MLDADPYPAETILRDISLLSPEILLGLILIMIFLFVSGLFSGSEAALFSLAPSDLEFLRKKNPQKGAKIAKLLNHPSHLLGAILIGNNLVNIAIIILSTYLLNQIFVFDNHPIIGFLVQIVGISFMILLFGEIIPKVYATTKTLDFALIVASPLTVITRIFGPLSKGLAGSVRLINQRITPTETITPEDLSKAIDLTTNVSSEEEDILKGIVEISSIEASEIMRPRIDLVTVEYDTDFADLLDIVRRSGYSRLPIYQENLDNIKGILYIKDLLPHLDKPNSFHWQSLIRPPYFVPENKPINDLLSELQEKHIHMAVVVDEYGGTSGIVTLEDIIEQIVGDISDEYDEEERTFAKINENTYLFEGKTSINDFCHIIDYDGDLFNEVNADTLAGLILEHTGDMPNQYDVVKIANFEFKVESVDRRRIKKVQVIIHPVEPKF